MPVFAFALLLSLRVLACERCIAIDGDTLVCNHQKLRLANVYAAEVYVYGKRIEQSDIGLRMGRGAQWQGKRHRARGRYRLALKNIPVFLAIFCAFVGSGRR